jgi:hypothetical protein
MAKTASEKTANNRGRKMKGIVFTTFNRLVEEKFGLRTWQSLLDQTGASGVYTSSGTYPDAELLAMVGVLSKESGIPVTDLVRAFGEFAFSRFMASYPHQPGSAKELLSSVSDIIHLEVKKLYADATPPVFYYQNPSDDRLIMRYESQRQLCPLVEGLVEGAAKYYGETIVQSHPRCVHRGDSECVFEVQFVSQAAQSVETLFAM